jgi:hypothetical protein
MSESKDKKTVVLVENDAEIERLKAELEEMRIRAENAEGKIQLISDAAFAKAKAKYKIEDESIDSPEKMKAYLLGKGYTENEKTGELEPPKPQKIQNPDLNPEFGSGASGKTPLNPPESGDSFENYDEMMKFLNEKANVEPKKADERREKEAAIKIINRLHKKQAENLQRQIRSGQTPEPMVFTGTFKDLQKGLTDAKDWKPESEQPEKKLAKEKHVLGEPE